MIWIQMCEIDDALMGYLTMMRSLAPPLVVVSLMTMSMKHTPACQVQVFAAASQVVARLVTEDCYSEMGPLAWRLRTRAPEDSMKM